MHRSLRPHLSSAAQRALLLALVSACGRVAPVHPRLDVQVEAELSVSLDQNVDILFVVDNSKSMSRSQARVARGFEQLIDALILPAGEVPNLHIGVISTDLGAGPYEIGRCVPGGDGAQLQSGIRCPQLHRNRWLAHIEGRTNIDIGAEERGTSPIAQLKQAFACMVQLGTEGCGFEQPLEAMRRALDPLRNTNPGFVRADALLAVVIVSDEDDCSVAREELLNPQPSAELGANHSFRCFEFGIRCVQNGRAAGPRHNCAPRGGWLHQLDDYERFLNRLKPPGRLLLAAIGGPPDRVMVKMRKSQPFVEASCRTESSAAAPGIRLSSLVQRLGDNGQFTSLCDADWGPAMERLGAKIVSSLGSHCLPPVVGLNGGLICRAGDVLGPTPTGEPGICQQTCLDEAACIVTERDSSRPTDPQPVQRCPAALFDAASSARSCDESCPCWRIVYSPHCAAKAARRPNALGLWQPADKFGSPYRLDILRRAQAPNGTTAAIRCTSSDGAWNTVDLTALPQCHRNGHSAARGGRVRDF